MFEAKVAPFHCVSLHLAAAPRALGPRWAIMARGPDFQDPREVQTKPTPTDQPLNPPAHLFLRRK